MHPVPYLSVELASLLHRARHVCLLCGTGICTGAISRGLLERLVAHAMAVGAVFSEQLSEATPVVHVAVSGVLSSGGQLLHACLEVLNTHPGDGM